MPRSVFGALAMLLALAASAAAQGHQHGAQQSDSSQAAMMQMHEQMQAMHEQMMQMHGQDGGMQGMQGQQGGMQGMQGMGQQQAMQGTCLASGSQAGLSALLLGSAADLGLTEAQRTQLQEVLDRARNQALEALTPEQRQKLEQAPAAEPVCPRNQGSVPSGS